MQIPKPRRTVFALLLCLAATGSFVAARQDTAFSLDKFLAKPFDLQQFKKIKGQSNSGGAGKTTHYYRPAGKGIYYAFFMFYPMTGYFGERPDNELHMENGLSIITFKPEGKNQHQYLDPAETLIAVEARYNDKDLPELAFIGLDSVKIKKKLGENPIRKPGCFIYASGKNALFFYFRSSLAMRLKYIRLNFVLTSENIPADLLKTE